MTFGARRRSREAKGKRRASGRGTEVCERRLASKRDNKMGRPDAWATEKRASVKFTYQTGTRGERGGFCGLSAKPAGFG